MEIYNFPPDGRPAFRHDEPTNDARFTPSLYYYVSWVDLPNDYYQSR